MTNFEKYKDDLIKIEGSFAIDKNTKEIVGCDTFTNLHKANVIKNDEFYTRFTDISKELINYKKHFKDKVILCNCDNPNHSAFWKYFHLNFNVLGLKKLISTYYDKDKSTYKIEYKGAMI